MNNLDNNNVDVLILGSGVAGLSLALSVANHARVLLISKESITASASCCAQGGIAAVMHQQDSIDSHIQDTLQVGGGLSHPDVVSVTMQQAKNVIDWLVMQGVEFTRLTNDDVQEPGFHLTREGGHSHRRVLHVADKTGAAIIETLTQKVLQHPNIHYLSGQTALDLIVSDGQCVGAVVLDNDAQQIRTILAKITLLATGGASSIYLYTSHPNVSSGDGIAMAWRAGCTVANLEFNQFHPTCLYHQGTSPFLISEAVRGEGGKLLLPSGEPFMHKYDPRAELASRDIVTRAIDTELKKQKISHVYLDISHLPAAMINKLFPTIAERCLQFDINITQQPIPVVPAAHYTCGGIKTDINGRTNLLNLYAIGEVACTGLHGANRMASNSLLECLVFAMNASRTILSNLPSITVPSSLEPAFIEVENTVSAKNASTTIDMTQMKQQIRHLMWTHVGIVRNDKQLNEVQEIITEINEKIAVYCQDHKVNKDLIELRNLGLVAQLTIACALARKESRGLHYNTDYPELLANAEDTLLKLNGLKA